MGLAEGDTATPRLKRLLVAGVLMGIIVGYVGPVRGYLAQHSALRAERTKLAGLQKERDGLTRRLEALEDPVVLEIVAREAGFARPGERVFRVSWPSTPSGGPDDRGER
jgi:cell division protein FtsB